MADFTFQFTVENVDKADAQDLWDEIQVLTNRAGNGAFGGFFPESHDDPVTHAIQTLEELAEELRAYKEENDG